MMELKQQHITQWRRITVSKEHFDDVSFPNGHPHNMYDMTG